MGSCVISSQICIKGSAPSFLIVCFRYIGDVLITTPLAVSIKQAIPGATVDYLVFEGTEGVLVNNPLIRKVISVPRDKSNTGVLLSLFRRYDIALAAYPSDRTVVAAATTGRHSVGLIYDGKGSYWKKNILSSYQPCDDSRHVVTNILSLLKPLGISPIPSLVMGYDDDDLAFARDAMPAEKYMVLHPYSRNKCKYWQASHWVSLAGLIRSETGCQVVFTRTPDPGDEEYLEQILAAAPQGVEAFKEACSLNRLAAAIKKSTAFIGIDTAVTHIAAALEIPTFAIFGPTLTRYWAPWPNGCQEASPFAANMGIQRKGQVTVVQQAWECVPCNRETCAISTRNRMECLEQLTPEEVFKEIMDNVEHCH